MKILYIANENIKKGMLEYTLLKSFREKNIKIDLIFPDEKVENRFALTGRIKTKLITYFKINEKEIFKKIKNVSLKEYDAVFVLKGTYITPEILKYIKEKNPEIKLSCYNPDDPYNKASCNDNIKKCIKYYDLYFIWSRKLERKIKEKENIKTVYLPFAADLSLHNKKFFPVVNKKYKITFIGNWDEEREFWLSAVEDKESLTVFGNNWGYKLKDKSLLKSFSGKSVIGKEYTKTVRESIVNINILRVQNKNSNNMRTFEIPASGGFLLHEYSDEVAEMFEEGKEMEFYRNREELNDKIKFYLKNPKLAEQIASKAYERIIKSDYTYDNRVNTIIRKLYEG